MISKFPMDQLYSYVVFFPAAILCYLPMKNQLVKPWKTLALQAGAAFLCLAIHSFKSCTHMRSPGQDNA